MRKLILLNGPPASGKSTLAKRWVADRPLTLNLDIDVVRGLLGGWIDAPLDAGLLARRLAVAMIDTHVAAGHDVIVPQFLAKPDFIVELTNMAQAAGAQFIEVSLIVEREEMMKSFALRSSKPETSEHRDAELFLARTGGLDLLGQMFDEYTATMANRPNAHRTTVVRGDIAANLANLESVILENV